MTKKWRLKKDLPALPLLGIVINELQAQTPSLRTI